MEKKNYTKKSIKPQSQGISYLVVMVGLVLVLVEIVWFAITKL